MSADTRSDDAVVAEVLKAEEQRCEAYRTGDWATLDAILSEDFTFTHATSDTEDKTTHIENVKQQLRKLRREGLKVRLYGDVAVMTGDLVIEYVNQGKDARPPASLYAIQVWVKQDGNWRLVAFQAARKPPTS